MIGNAWGLPGWCSGCRSGDPAWFHYRRRRRAAPRPITAFSLPPLLAGEKRRGDPVAAGGVVYPARGCLRPEWLMSRYSATAAVHRGNPAAVG
ncbi:hypothetical protein LNP74_28670 [Klebsiella pneumoniae subsp. pneumoniae]|nr:hypothetical protein [Klebsiella pneumoniae subsp. pneumoniae]